MKVLCGVTSNGVAPFNDGLVLGMKQTAERTAGNISPGINSSPTANAWRGTGPIAKSSRGQPVRAFVCCKACCSVGFAGGV